jgi:hypothetical protein
MPGGQGPTCACIKALNRSNAALNIHLLMFFFMGDPELPLRDHLKVTNGVAMVCGDVTAYALNA